MHYLLLLSLTESHISNYSQSKTIHFEQPTTKQLLQPVIDSIQQHKFENAITQFEKIKQQLHLQDLPVLDNGYTRNILESNNGWLAILKWDKNSKTPIHGHPDFAFVYVVQGEIINASYNLQEGSLASPKRIGKGEYFYSTGDKNKFNNAPHRIATQQPAITLHFYSDDGKKGTIYN
jgi:predicted metal-dependent enzyme (double-stranded beta helix superfamily)